MTMTMTMTITMSMTYWMRDADKNGCLPVCLLPTSLLL